MCVGDYHWWEGTVWCGGFVSEGLLYGVLWCSKMIVY